MWVQLSSDFLNLNHVTRVRFSTVWKNAQEYLVAEIDTLEGGEIKQYTRYRGADAEVLRAALCTAAVPAPSSLGDETPRPSPSGLATLPDL
jgi:hypothetical protein